MALGSFAFTLTGCATYSDMVNSLGPERRVSDLRESIEAPLQLSEAKSPFCFVPSETYIVMPEEGRVGTVVVSFVDGAEHVLEGDYEGMSVSGNQLQTFTGDAKMVNELFGDAVSALPPAPYHAKLYFLLDKDELTPESKILAKAVFDEITNRQVAAISIIGHTDTAASYRYNEELSLRRALKVQKALIEMGIAAEIITTEGKGEYQLLVDTPDNTPEPKNRRVEIDVR
jgi:hypothetical protein